MYEDSNRTIYISNLDETVTEELLTALFSQMGEVTSCKITRDALGEVVSMVEFSSHVNASLALSLNQRTFLGKEMKVKWAGLHFSQKPNRDLTNHHHVYVGDLSPDVDVDILRDAFAPFGEISHVAISRDPETLKAKGYGFVVFVQKHEAENAIAAMNGQWLGNKPIKTNWSTRKIQTIKKPEKTLTYDDIYGQASSSNSTVYCGGIFNGLTEELLMESFSPFGTIQDIKCHPDRGYAFIKYVTKGCAARAILNLNGTEINGFPVRCSWGKELVEKYGQSSGDLVEESQHSAATDGMSGAWTSHEPPYPAPFMTEPFPYQKESFDYQPPIVGQGMYQNTSGSWY